MTGRAETTTRADARGTAARKPAPEARRPDDRHRGTQPRTHADDAVATVLMREAYTRERHYFLMRTIFALIGLVALSVGSNVWQWSKRPEARYFLTTYEGRLTEVTPLDRPIDADRVVLNWAVKGVVQAYTFNFANYRSELTQARANFTETGWRGFEKALKDSGNLDAVIGNKYVATAVPKEAPVLVDRGLVDGVAAWKVQVPILVTYASAAQKTEQNLLVDVTVVRVPETQNPSGLGIAQLLAK